MKGKSTFIVSLFLLSLMIPIDIVIAQEEYSREIEIGVYDDYVEIMSYNYLEGSQSAHATEMEIRLYTDGGEGPLSLEFEYYSESVASGSSSESSLYFSLIFKKFIEYKNEDFDGAYNPGSDTLVKSVLLGDRGIVMYSNPLVNQISMNGKKGYQILINGTIPEGGDQFDFNLIGYIFEEHVIINGLEISPLEFKFDLEINNFPYNSSENDLSLQTILVTEFETESNNNPTNSYVWIENNHFKGYYGWLEHALIDGFSQPVTSSSVQIGEDTIFYLCYKSGSSIFHDPSIGLWEEKRSTPFLIIFNIILLCSVGILLLIIVISKTDFREYLTNRRIFIKKGPHKLSIEDVLDNEFRSKIIDVIIDNPGIHYKELFRQIDTSPSNLAWHLEILEVYKIIKKERMGRYLIFYTWLDKNPFRNFDIKVAKSETTLEVYKNILENPGTYLNKISKETKVHYKVVKYHINKLLDADLIRSEKKSKGRISAIYFVKSIDEEILI